jgi:hypothetical protein
MAEIAKEVSTIGGIATVSVLHSFIPTHWLPFSIVGRAQKWSIWQTLLVSKCSPAPLLFPFSEWECLPLFWEMWRTVVIDCYNLHCFVDSSGLSTAAARFCSSQKEEPDFFLSMSVPFQPAFFSVSVSVASQPEFFSVSFYSLYRLNLNSSQCLSIVSTIST